MTQHEISVDMVDRYAGILWKNWEKETYIKDEKYDYSSKGLSLQGVI